MYPAPGTPFNPAALSGVPQPNQITMAMHQQQVQQQRMMMQQPGPMHGYGAMGARTMYGQGTMMNHPQQMMPGQGMINMYQQQQLHQQQLQQQQQQQQLQQQQQAMAQPRDFMKEFPNEWRNAIMSETNQERKGRMYQMYAKQIIETEQQQKLDRSKATMNAYQMASSSMNQSPNINMMPNQMSMNYGKGNNTMRSMTSSQPSVTNQSIASQSPHNSTLGFSSQASVAGSPAAALSVSLPSPHSNIAPPATPQSKLQDGSQTTPPNNDNLEDFIALREQMKDMYYERLKLVGEHCALDGTPLPRGYSQMIEIFENKRIVKIDLLRSALKTLVVLLERHDLTYSFTNELASDIEPSLSSTDSSTKVHCPDPWKDIRSKFLRVPKDLSDLRTEDDKENSDPNKLTKGKEPVAKVDNNLMNEGKVVKEENVSVKENTVIELNCQFDTSRKWIMSDAASKELKSLPWSIDDDFLPASFKVPNVRIHFEAKKLLLPPLVVLLPKSYPSESPIVKFDKSFPPTAPFSSSMSSLFERRLALAPNRSLTSFYEAFSMACEDLMRLKI